MYKNRKFIFGQDFVGFNFKKLLGAAVPADKNARKNEKMILFS